MQGDWAFSADRGGFVNVNWQLISRNGGHRAELSKADVECEDRFDGEILHYHFAGAIRKAPILVAELKEYLPGFSDIQFLQKVQIGYSAGE
jgi:hypothetical protein